jgi:hypothetical protein
LAGSEIVIPAAQRETCQTATAHTSAAGNLFFDTEDGLIANWTAASNIAAAVFDNSASGAVYKGLVVLNSNLLLAANFNSGKVDILTSNFSLTSLNGSFTEPNLLGGYASPRQSHH